MFVLICDDDRPALRVDLYRDNTEAMVFKGVTVWRGHVFVGFGQTVYVIDPKAPDGFAIRLESYFSKLYAGGDYLLVASAEAVWRLAPDGKILWKTAGLGIDGVVVKSVDQGIVEGDGEWDPPGGWIPFWLRLDTGQVLTVTTQYPC